MRSLILFLSLISSSFGQSSFDLRASKLVTENKKQSWGTCWAFASVAALESSILIERSWSSEGEVDLSEYHMDKFSGFNRNGHADHVASDSYSGQGEGYQGSNTDDPTSGLIVHLGGDYKIAAAYLSNTSGAVEEIKTPSIGFNHSYHERFGNLPNEGVKKENNYTHYLPKSIEWLTYGSFDGNIKRIKESIKEFGSVGSAQYLQHEPYDTNIYGEEVHYYYGPEEPTHAVNLIGWDDEKVVIPFLPGVWIVQDSDHYNEVTGHIGYFITPFADVYTGQHKEFGGVSFRSTRSREISRVHSHALHGWQYEFESEKVSNIFSLKENETPLYASAYAARPKDRLLILITDMEGNLLCHSSNEEKENPGFYLLKLRCDEDALRPGKIRVELRADSKKYAHDGSKVYRPLLKGSEMPEFGAPILVPSKSEAGQSYYFQNGKWIDFNTYHFKDDSQYGINLNLTSTANFAINLYTK